MANTRHAGTTFNDMVLAGKVRNLALGHIQKILAPDYKDKKYQKEVLLVLAKNILPRLNEHSGPDGGAIEIKGVDISFRE